MLPTSSRDFQRVSLQRLTTAQFLLAKSYNLDAMYLAGYSIECSLKALILHLTPTPERSSMFDRITTSAAMHRPEVLATILRRDLQASLPPGLIRKIYRFRWTTDLRYELGRIGSGEARGFLKMCKAVHDWVEGQLP